MKNIKKLIAALLAVCMMLCFCACGGNGDDNSTTTTESTTESTTEEQIAFKVKVVDEAGKPVAGVMMQICKDSCIPARTGDDGVAVFADMEITDGYKLSVLSCPAGYEYTGDAEIYLESGSTEYTVEIKAVA